MKFNKREFRSSVRRVLFNECGETIKTCTREQLNEAVHSCIEMLWHLYDGAGEELAFELGGCVRPMFKGK